MDAALCQPLVGHDEFANAVVGKRDVMNPSRSRRWVSQPRRIEKGEAMVLIVIGQESERFVLERCAGVKDGPIEVHHFGVPRRAHHHVGQFLRAGNGLGWECR
ncbi:hypothetical protein D3C85_693880 [compost metagenome]